MAKNGGASVFEAMEEGAGSQMLMAMCLTKIIIYLDTYNMS